jgi:hypothetical protein
MNDDVLEQLLEETSAEPAEEAHAPSRLKSRIYSALMRVQAESGTLLSLPDCRAAGRGLCVFESLTAASPTDAVKQLNICRVCHARVLAEHVDGAPIYWPNCPYAGFQNR